MKLGRVRVALQSIDPTVLWRVVERATERPAALWTSSDMHAPSGEPLDKGGFEGFFDAYFFACGVNYERALVGELEDVTTDDIDRERLEAEHLEASHGQPPSPLELDRYGLEAYRERRKHRARVRKRWDADAARRLALAL